MRLTYIKLAGLFTLIFGIFAQLLGLYRTFSAIEQIKNVSPSILAGGLKVSMITTLYRILIFLLSWLRWMTLDYGARKKSSSVLQG